MTKIIILIVLVLVSAVGGFIWFLIDYPSVRHWIIVNPIVDASSQKEGVSGFVLPAGRYVIVVSGNSRNEAGTKIDIDYILDIPSQAIHIEKQKKVDVGFVDTHLLDEITINKHGTEGFLKVQVLTPSKGKVSIGLATNRYAWM